MLLRINEKIVDIVHDYVIRRLVAAKGVVYSGTITGPLDRIFNGTFGRQSHITLFDKAGGNFICDCTWALLYGWQ
jgi:hypothetical protein